MAGSQALGTVDVEKVSRAWRAGFAGELGSLQLDITPVLLDRWADAVLQNLRQARQLLLDFIGLLKKQSGLMQYLQY